MLLIIDPGPRRMYRGAVNLFLFRHCPSKIFWKCTIWNINIQKIWLIPTSKVCLVLDQVYFTVWLTVQAVSCFHSSAISDYKTVFLLVKRRNNAKKKKICSSRVLKCPVLPMLTPSKNFILFIEWSFLWFVKDVEDFFHTQSCLPQ